MKLWIRKIAVVLIAILTLGIYTPTYLIADKESNEVISPSENDGGLSTIDSSVEDSTQLDIHIDSADGDYVDAMTEIARDQTIAKLGPRIIEKVENEFMTQILPNMEEALQTILLEAGEEQLVHYSVTEQLTEGYGEKIFNVYDHLTKKDIARFHVRRDNRPQEGYWFNFHYHVSKDGFENHHTIGEIYWDKNTPPKWMA